LGTLVPEAERSRIGYQVLIAPACEWWSKWRGACLAPYRIFLHPRFSGETARGVPRSPDTTVGGPRSPIVYFCIRGSLAKRHGACLAPLTRPWACLAPYRIFLHPRFSGEAARGVPRSPNTNPHHPPIPNLQSPIPNIHLPIKPITCIITL
jgi:hypothetical protein